MRTTLGWLAAPLALCLVLGAGCDSGERSSGPTVLTITSTSPLPDAPVNQSYSEFIQAVAGQLPYTWSIVAGNLPMGLMFDTTTGEISGTATMLGQSTTFTVEVQDAAGSRVQASFTLDVVKVVTYVTPAVLPPARVGNSYAELILAQGGDPPYTFMLSPVVGNMLPPGMQLVPVQSVGAPGTFPAQAAGITGTPITAGTFLFTINVEDTLTNGFQARASRTFELTINP